MSVSCTVFHVHVPTFVANKNIRYIPTNGHMAVIDGSVWAWLHFLRERRREKL